jgi:hypothetical protein
MALTLLLSDAAGTLINRQEWDDLLASVATEAPTDVFLLAHGWNNNLTIAQASYLEMLGVMDAVARDRALRPAEYRPLVLGIIWPSRAWDSSTNEAVPAAVVFENLSPERSAGQYSRDALLMQHLLTRPTLSGPDLQGFLELLGRYSEPPRMPEEESAFDTPEGVMGGLEGAFSPGDLFRAFTFWQMKKRAGVVGGNGGQLLLDQLQRACPAATRFHLFGHSFGCKLWLSAVAGTAAPLPRPIQTLVLVQGAISHEAFADQVTGRAQPGGYRAALEPERVDGPIVATFSAADSPLNLVYPLGAGVAGQQGELEALRVSRFSALGAVGAFGVRGDRVHQAGMVPEGTAYGFGPGLWSVDGGTPPNNFITEHGEFQNRHVAWMLWSAIRRT